MVSESVLEKSISTGMFLYMIVVALIKSVVSNRLLDINQSSDVP